MYDFEDETISNGRIFEKVDGRKLNKPKGLRELLRKVRFKCIHWKIEAVNFTQFFFCLYSKKFVFLVLVHCLSLLLDSTMQLLAMRISKVLILDLSDTVHYIIVRHFYG